jgi:hypothetical protein
VCRGGSRTWRRLPSSAHHEKSLVTRHPSSHPDLVSCIARGLQQSAWPTSRQIEDPCDIVDAVDAAFWGLHSGRASPIAASPRSRLRIRKPRTSTPDPHPTLFLPITRALALDARLASVLRSVLLVTHTRGARIRVRSYIGCSTITAPLFLVSGGPGDPQYRTSNTKCDESHPAGRGSALNTTHLHPQHAIYTARRPGKSISKTFAYSSDYRF